MDKIGTDCFGLIEKLYPICRSITGDGVRQTLHEIKENIPLEIHEIPTGTAVFDWSIPKEWNIKDAWVINHRKEKVIDFNKSNLHILNYSIPYQGKLTFSQLKPHLYSLPEFPDWIPYRTSYHHPHWGFCVSHNDLLQMEDGEYEVFIDSSLESGSLTYGEFLVPGQTKDEVLISCHICHPSLCNDNLSGIAIATHLAKTLSDTKNRYSYRFIFIPATIGAITWLYFNKNKTKRIKHGLVATLLGDPGKFHYKKSRRGNAEIDRAAIYALQNSGYEFEIRNFSPYGYDERQYCSPGFNLPVGCFMRSPHGEFPEYHTSADNLGFIHPEYLSQSFLVLKQIFEVLENNRKYVNLKPYCEPQLGKRGLYQQISGDNDQTKKDKQLSLLWLLNQSDGNQDLLNIANKSGIKFDIMKKAADNLVESGLLSEKYLHKFDWKIIKKKIKALFGLF